jgi:hypothetical protein
MASIDAILEQVLERGADALVLRTGAIPIVRVGTATVPVQRVKLGADQVLALTRPMASPEDAARLDRGEPVTFRYKDFHVRVAFEPTGPSVELVPNPVEDEAATAPYARSERPPAPELSPPPPPESPFALAEPPRAIASSRVKSIPPPAGDALVSSSMRPPPVADERPRTPPPAWVAPPTPAAQRWKLGVLAFAIVAVLAFWLWPVEIPNVSFSDAEGKVVTLLDLHAGKRDLVVVFLMDDPVSRFAADAAKEAYASKSGKTAFVALVFGDAAVAESKKDLALPFPAVGVRAAKDPFALQEFFKKAGASTLVGASMYGGTTILLDAKNRVSWKLEQEGVQKLPEKLAKLRD